MLTDNNCTSCGEDLVMNVIVESLNYTSIKIHLTKRKIYQRKQNFLCEALPTLASMIYSACPDPVILLILLKSSIRELVVLSLHYGFILG